MLLLAAATAPDPKIAKGSWDTWDWVAIFGLGLIALGYMVKKHWLGTTEKNFPPSQNPLKSRKRENRS